MKTLKVFLSIFCVIAIANVSKAATHQIKMLNSLNGDVMVFDPPFLMANKGDTIKFVPTDSGHDVASVAIPKGAKPWAGKSGEAVTIKVTEEGLYLYECKLHIAMAMVGVIQVGAAKNLSEVQTAAQTLSKSFAMYKDRLDRYLLKVKK